MKTKNIYFYTGWICLFFGILPLQLNPGTAVLLLAGGVLLTSHKWSQKWRKYMLPLFTIALIAVFLYLSTLFYFGHCRNVPADLQQETVVVLGCKINGNRPSQMLKRRLDAAAQYLKNNPDANCIVTGGQGYNEIQTEASVMGQYLMDAGIEAERIFYEDKSTNTRENLSFAKDIIEKEELNEHIVIISDGFHQFRAYLIANKLGLPSYGLSGHTSWWLIPSYCVREIFSLIKLIPFFLSA